MAIDPQLLDILVCPACHGGLRELPAPGGLECQRCGRVYPIRDGIPVMLIDEATAPTREGPAPPAGPRRAADPPVS
jgi:uncharacterized protein YbaR (Trm112 family)